MLRRAVTRVLLHAPSTASRTIAGGASANSYALSVSPAAPRALTATAAAAVLPLDTCFPGSRPWEYPSRTPPRVVEVRQAVRRTVLFPIKCGISASLLLPAQVPMISGFPKQAAFSTSAWEKIASSEHLVSTTLLSSLLPQLLQNQGDMRLFIHLLGEQSIQRALPTPVPAPMRADSVKRKRAKKMKKV